MKMKIPLFITGILFQCSILLAQDYFFKDPQYSFECLRVMGYSCTGGADIKECLNTASRIKDADNESWYREWYATAERLENTACQFLKDGHKKSAMEAYFRASNYYRTAEFFLHNNPDDPRIIETWGRSRACFLEAIALSDRQIEYVRIPYEGTTLPGYFCFADNTGKTKPLLIIHSGFDGTAEELYFEIGVLALERGFNCLLFEGPGQGEVIRQQKIPFRHDWESVVTPIVDYALTRPEVDPERIGLLGISFGGYLAPRAAAFEDRIKVCIANGGIFSFYEVVIERNAPDILDILNDEEATKEYDKEVMEAVNFDVNTGWFFANGMFTFGADTPSELIRKIEPYSLNDCADKIQCTMLVIDSEDDNTLPGQAIKLFDALKCPKEFMLFTEKEGAEEHCQMGAIMISNERILNWLEENL